MINYVMQVFRKYAVFEGRASRSEYWYFVLFNFLVRIVLIIIGGVIGDDMEILSVVYVLATIVPTIAVGVRRMHDVGKSGWFFLIPFYNFILAVADSEYGPNRFGLNPHGEGNDENDDMMEHLIEE